MSAGSDPIEAEPDLAGRILWVPDADRVVGTQLDRFRRRYRPQAADSQALWQWSVAEPARFWPAVWDWGGVIGDPGSDDRALVAGSVAEGWPNPSPGWTDVSFFPDARMNLAENLLAPRPGADRVAIVAASEDGPIVEVTWDQLRQDVAAMAAWLRSIGVEPGDRVAAWMPHRPETVVMFLAAAAVGAVFTSTSADFGVDGVVDRFGQTEPRVLLAADRYTYGGRSFDLIDRLEAIAGALPTLDQVVLVSSADAEIPSGLAGVTVESWTAAIETNRGAAPHYADLPGDHPLYILYSSGTTGKPKCIVHRAAGVLLKHLSEQRLHCDIGPGDRLFFFTTCGWMMWNWLVSGLAVGATIVCYDGNPTHPTPGTLFDLAERVGVSLFGVSAKYLDAVAKTGYQPRDHHDLSSVRTVCSTGSPLGPEGFAFVYEAINPEVHLASMSGGTDLCGCLVMGDPTRPVRAGEIQGPALGLDIVVADDRGQPVGPGIKGELVCRNPFPSAPLGFWADQAGSRYRSAYFDRFPGWWAHGDFASWTEQGGMIIHGRSDATLNASGVRIGTAEIYRVVEQRPEVVEAIAVAQEWDGDTRVVLFVRLADGIVLDDGLVATIKSDLRTRCSPRHVPSVVASVDDIPRTKSGKIVELAVTEVVHGRSVDNIEALANPEALEQFRNRGELG